MLTLQIAVGIWLGFCFCAGLCWAFAVTAAWFDRNRGWYGRLAARWDGDRA